MVFQQNLLKKSYFVAKMSGLAGQFLLLESALSNIVHTASIRDQTNCQVVAYKRLKTMEP